MEGVALVGTTEQVGAVAPVARACGAITLARASFDAVSSEARARG